jgi:predicted glycosyltransferase
MNREAAALGVPVYSIFSGNIGAVDRDLQRQGRLTLVERAEDVERKILLQARRKDAVPKAKPGNALQQIVNHVEEIVRLDCCHCAQAQAGLG